MFENPTETTKDIVKAELIDLKNFMELEGIFVIDFEFNGKYYQLNLAEIYQTDIDYSVGTVNEINANSIINYMSAIRGGLVTILDRLIGEKNEIELAFDTFMAEKTKLAEEAIVKEREKLIEEKKKKEIGMVTQAQITTFIIQNYGEQYTNFLSRKKEIDRIEKKIERLDKVLAHRTDRLNDTLNRQRRTLGA